jgi:hypothetical protein
MHLPGPTLILLLALGALLSACSGDSARLPPPSRLIHSPPINQLADQQLRALSMECQKYEPDKSTRGPYDAAYCESAIAAWGDAPLQIVPIGKDEPALNSPQPTSRQP